MIDFVGQNYFQGNLDVAARDGRIVTLGALSGTKLKEGVDIGAFVRKRLRFEGSSLRSRDVEYQVRSILSTSLRFPFSSCSLHPSNPVTSNFKSHVEEISTNLPLPQGRLRDRTRILH